MRRKSRNSKSESENGLEIRRQAVHAAGILAVPVILFLERPAAMAVLGGLLTFLIVLAFLRARKRTDGVLERFVLERERPGEFPLNGAIFFFLGTLIALLLFAPINAAAAVAVLALGDSASTVAGKIFGRHRLPFNPKKSWEGSATFALFAFAVLLLFASPQKALAVATLAAAAESLPELEDNFTVPVVAGLLMTLL